MAMVVSGEYTLGHSVQRVTVATDGFDTSRSGKAVVATPSPDDFKFDAGPFETSDLKFR